MSSRPEAPPWLEEPPDRLRVWAFEPYFGGSHKSFLEGLAAHSRHDYVLHTLPGRDWKWRMHGAAVTMAREALPASGAPHGQRSDAPHRESRSAPQVVFASDMLDLATFKALAHPDVSAAPTILYMHENQLSYPLPPGVERDLGYGVKNLTSALAADCVLFNSDFHRREFLEALAEMLAGLPDAVPDWAVDEVSARSEVLPLGCRLTWLDDHRPGGGAATHPAGRWGERDRGPLILWNQRWEYDKAPGDLFAALYALQEAGVGFRLAMAGANHGVPTAGFVEARERLRHETVQWGKVETRADYASLLWEADIVVSTALHEFFGVAVVEALYCGCLPVLPRRLSYPEIVPRQAHDIALYEEGRIVEALERALEYVGERRRGASSTPWSMDWQRTWVSRYDWSAMASRYDATVHSCWEGARR